ncbi:MAG: dTDP-glucose 4,6-dehydratase [Clostridiales bacterium]|jgi:dTDP-glucose 4,6-dehydratase|nr:dTDP-glucose 4,6-dehydratase [Clostridiales bacterium]
MNKPTFLTTGGAGFIGSNFIRFMLSNYKDSIKVINLDSLTYAGNLENLSEIDHLPNYRFIKADICDEQAVDYIFLNNDIDFCVHFAAESHVDRSIKDPSVFVKTNVLGTVNLLNAAKKHWQTGTGFKSGKKFVQVSTDEVYGSLGAEGYFTEKTPLAPHSPYSASKASADMLVQSYFDTYGFPMNITRCSNNYGPFQFPEKLIPLVINNARAGKPLPVYGDGKNVRDWLYVEDHARAIDLVARKGTPGEVYNVGGHNELQNIEIVKIILDSLGSSHDLITYVEDRLGHDRRYAIDASKIKSELGWEPETSFGVGIKRTIEWYLKNNGWLKNAASGDYLKYYERMYGGTNP